LNLHATTITCDTTGQQSMRTFATSAHMKAPNTATVDGALLATSDGQSEMDRSHLGSTRKGCVGVVRGLFGVRGGGGGDVGRPGAYYNMR
jgi:hypothetical protein